MANVRPTADASTYEVPVDSRFESFLVIDDGDGICARWSPTP